MSTTGRAPRPAAYFRRACARAVLLLPGRLRTVVPPSLIAFMVIGGFTFGVDLLLLSLLHGVLRIELGVALTLAYVTALGLNFLLNRWLTFTSRRPVGVQLVLYATAVALNYVVIVLGVTVVLDAVGAPYLLARTAAGALEVGFLYSAQRWVVFAHGRPGARDRDGTAVGRH